MVGGKIIVMKKYYRLMLGRQHKYFNECYDNKYVGVGFDIEIDLKNEYAIFSGPSFAKEVAKGKPAALVLAARSLKLAEKISNHISLKD